MKLLIFVGTLTAVTNAFSSSPSGLNLHNSVKSSGYHYSKRYVLSYFQVASKGSRSALMMPLPSNDKFLEMTSSQSDERSMDDKHNDDKMAKKVVGRKKRVVVGYLLTAALYLLTTVMTTIILIKQQVNISFIAYYSCGNILAGGLAFILKDAAENDRLRSDTYKRLNLFTAWYGFLMSIITVKIFKPPQLLLVTHLIAMINSIKGYGYGARGWTLREGVPFSEDLAQGVKGTIRSMFRTFPKDVKSAGYLLGTAVVKIIAIFKCIEVINIFLGGGGITFLFWTRLHRCSKLGLLSVCMYTLKDAADRDRLDGTTFIQLNFLSSLVWASMLGYILFRNPLAVLGTKSTLEPTVTAALAGFFALFTAGNGIVSIVEKEKA